ncbi:MAG TPA: hypothetical protein VG897_14705 [Terriglobales bacterium]|nr:hypothetical protein [Terriglobales bacterium]
MSLKAASLLAFLGTALLTILELLLFARDASAAINGVAPMMQLLSSAIRLFAAAMLALFFFFYHRHQS